MEGNECQRKGSTSHKATIRVISEYGVGMPEFINALLREKILQTDINPSATGVMTSLEYAPEMKLACHYEDSACRQYTLDSMDALKKKVLQAGEGAEKPTFMDVAFPSELLKRENLRMISYRYQDGPTSMVCKAPLMTIVLTSAMVPMPMSLTKMITEQLSGNLSSLAIVITHMDRIGKRHRKDLMNFVRATAKRIGAEDAVIVSYAADTLMDHCKDGVLQSGQDNELVAMCLESEKQIFEKLNQLRTFDDDAEEYEAEDKIEEAEEDDEDSFDAYEPQNQAASDFFSWENAGEFADINGHVAFASNLMDRYEWNAEERQLLKKKLARIRAKQNDKKLNMSVIGEFSTGKSTFINALLRMELLEEDVIQGTTVAATVLEHAPDMKIECMYANSGKDTQSFSDFDSLKQRLGGIASNNDDAQSLDRVSVSLPTEWLREGNYRIIDTPGLNATTHWHSEVTERVIHDMSDVSIILTDATQPMPKTLMEFVSGNLKDVLRQCIFVVTKFDRIRPRERDRVLSHVTTLAKQLGVENPLVLPYSSIKVLEAFEDDALANDNPDEMLAMSLETEKRILAHMAKNRLSAQLKRVISLVTGMYDEISVQMEEMTGDCKARISALEKARTKDLTGFIKEQKELRSADYREDAYYEQSVVREEAEKNRGYSFSMIDDEIGKITSYDNIQKTVETLNTRCKKQAQNLYKKILENSYNRCITAVYKQQSEKFITDFKEQFSDLDAFDIMGGDFSVEFKPNSVPEFSGMSQMKVEMQNAVKADNFSFGGRIAAGAATGAILGLGPVGALVGGVIGAFSWASSSDKKLAEYKKTTIAKVREMHRTYYDQVIQSAVDASTKHIKRAEGDLMAQIDMYHETYINTVNKRLNEEKKNMEKLRRQAQGLMDDMKQIDNRRMRLSSVMAQIG